MSISEPAVRASGLERALLFTIVAHGAAAYGSDSDQLAGVAPWLPCLYFAAGAVAFRLWNALQTPGTQP